MNKRSVIVAGAAASLVLSGMIIAIPALGSSPPTAESQVGAFSSTSPSVAVSSANVPAAVSASMTMLPGPDANQGEAVTTDVHELMSGLGTHRVGVYGYPTSTGSVCVVATETVPVGTCVDGSDLQSTPISVAVYMEAGVSPSVVGVVSNDVVGVDVVVNGVSEPATLSDSGVYYQAPAGTSAGAITGVVAQLDDGTSIREPLQLTAGPPPGP
jgi:hypothetical protein